MAQPAELELPVKAETAVATANADDKAFAWEVCSDTDIHTRVIVKQQAVDDALRHALKISQELRAPNDDEPSSAPTSFEERCGSELIEWTKEIDELHQKSQAFEVLIGVAGRTGAGKSTILNMLLEIPELLPSSNSEAATSCACRVSWNNDDDPDRIFRAEVVFRSREDVAQELQQLFAMVQERQQLNESDTDDDDEPFARMEEEAEIESAIAEGFKKINAVWGLDEDTVECMSADDLLLSNPDVLQMLGTTKTVYSREAEQFAEQVKPYLDSSENLQGIRSWPLITEVRLFVKAPFLKHGVVLVDLPGLSDAVESRAEVANKFAKKLQITAIVAPARRAIDEKTGVQLMSDYQTLRMQLDGRYNKKSFCVVVSQVDEIDCDVFIKGDALAKQDQGLLKDIENIKVLTKQSEMYGAKAKTEATVLAKIDEKLAKADTKIAALKPTGPGSQKLKQEKSFQDKVAKARDDKKRIKRSQISQRRTVEKFTQNKAVTEQKLAMLRARQKWACISRRNRHITKAIKRDFAKRQKALAREMGQTNEYDGSVDVIPVSATAFRDHLKGREPAGFPTKRHSGIPRLRQWLADSTLERREEHLDALLNALRRLFQSIQHWSVTNCSDQMIQFSRDATQDLLARTHAQFMTKLAMKLERGASEVQTLNPFKQIGEVRERCGRVACKAVTRWVVKVPEDKTSAVLMHWTTFNAILKRKGGPYYSRGREKREYNLPEAMVVPILTTLLEGWHRIFRVEIPSAEEPIMQYIEEIWEQYLDELKGQIQATAPDIMPHFEETMQNIHGIVKEMRDKIHAALRGLSECASDVHPEFLGALREQLEPIFEESLEIKGTGHFQKRRKFLYDNVKEQSDVMFVAGYKKMRKKYKMNVIKLPQAFSEMASFVGAKVMTQISLLMDRLGGASGQEWAVADMQPSLQQRLQTAIMEWQVDWRLPKLEEGCLRREDIEIPREFIEEEQAVAVKQETKSVESEGEEDGEDGDGEDGDGDSMEE